MGISTGGIKPSCFRLSELAHALDEVRRLTEQKINEISLVVERVRLIRSKLSN